MDSNDDSSNSFGSNGNPKYASLHAANFDSALWPGSEFSEQGKKDHTMRDNEDLNRFNINSPGLADQDGNWLDIDQFFEPNQEQNIGLYKESTGFADAQDGQVGNIARDMQIQADFESGRTTSKVGVAGADGGHIEG